MHTRVLYYIIIYRPLTVFSCIRATPTRSEKLVSENIIFFSPFSARVFFSYIFYTLFPYTRSHGTYTFLDGAGQCGIKRRRRQSGRVDRGDGGLGSAGAKESKMAVGGPGAHAPPFARCSARRPPPRRPFAQKPPSQRFYHRSAAALGPRPPHLLRDAEPF